MKTKSTALEDPQAKISIPSIYFMPDTDTCIKWTRLKLGP